MMRRLRGPTGVLVLTLSLTSLVALVAWRMALERDRLRFENAVQAAGDRLSARLDIYVAMLRGAQGLFAASDGVTREEFASFVARLDLPGTYPGIQGIGFTERFLPHQQEALEARMRAQGVEAFRAWPEDDRQVRHAILFLEPLDRRNRAALGFDMSTEPTRREAMERARDSGRPAMSGRVTLVQEIEGPTQPGFLVYVPVYSGRGVPHSVQERREKLQGFVYAPFRAVDLFDRLFGSEESPRVAVAIFDGAPSADTLLFDERPDRGVHAPAFTTLQTLEVAGRSLSLVVESQRPLEAVGHVTQPAAVLGMGLVLSLVFYAASRGRMRERELAEQERRRAVTLSRLALAFNSELDEDRLVQRLTDEGTSLTGAAFGAYFHNLPDETGRYGLYALSGAPREAFEKMPPVRTTPIFAHTFHDKGTLRLDDVTRSPLFGKNPPYNGLPGGHLPVKSYLATTVKGRNGRVLGGLFFGHPEPGEFLPEHEPLVEGLAAQAAVALDNARLYREAQAAIALRDEFLSVASHELKTPLTPLTLRLEQLAGRAEAQAQLPGPEVSQLVLVIRRQVQRLSRLVTDLLDVSRITSGKLRVEREQVDLREVVREAVARVEPVIERTGGKISVQAPDPVVGQWDPARLEQVVVNLLDNALKYGDGKPVAVTVRADGGQAHLTVVDEGIGIPEDRVGRVFERFERAVSERNYGGLGLGLFIVREIVVAHGGEVTVDSLPGRGSRFEVTLPLLPLL